MSSPTSCPSVANYESPFQDKLGVILTEPCCTCGLVCINFNCLYHYSNTQILPILPHSETSQNLLELWMRRDWRSSRQDDTMSLFQQWKMLLWDKRHKLLPLSPFNPRLVSQSKAPVPVKRQVGFQPELLVHSFNHLDTRHSQDAEKIRNKSLGQTFTSGHCYSCEG